MTSYLVGIAWYFGVVIALYFACCAARSCQCGTGTGGEEAYIGGQIWCHPCADAIPSTEQHDG